VDGYEWDPRKAAANLAKHNVDFADAALSLEDPLALTMPDPDERVAKHASLLLPLIRQDEFW
jgi:uncharacterized DUF497 family protein